MTSRTCLVLQTTSIVITGASAGIGAALAKAIAASGGNYELMLIARRQVELEEVARECGPIAKTFVADVTKRYEALFYIELISFLLRTEIQF